MLICGIYKDHFHLTHSSEGFKSHITFIIMLWICLHLTFLAYFPMLATSHSFLNMFASWTGLSELHICRFLCLDHSTHHSPWRSQPTFKGHLKSHLFHQISQTPQPEVVLHSFATVFPSSRWANSFGATFYYWPVTLSDECSTAEVTQDMSGHILFSLNASWLCVIMLLSVSVSSFIYGEIPISLLRRMVMTKPASEAFVKIKWDRLCPVPQFLTHSSCLANLTGVNFLYPCLAFLCYVTGYHIILSA